MSDPAQSMWTAPRQTLDPRVVRVWTTSAAIATVVTAAAVCGLAAAFALAGIREAAIAALIAAGLVALGGSALTAVWPRRRFARFRWDVDDDGVVVRRGWLWEVLHIVPHTRVQAVDARSGPLERRHGLATLHLRTASATGSPRIPGLERGAAEALAAEVARRAGAEDAT